MLETEPAPYEVVGRQNNHLWLEILEGGDQGIRVSVPVHDSEYSENIQKQVQNLSVGDVKELILVSDSEQRPDWRISDFCGNDGAAPDRVPGLA
ncbi:hypothetical protein [Haloplanus aerogenes]|uniref:Uncharacterized protein n=1 Tax=Haloplanus aerogenes TaxID=660522 RepID=A0A3G8QX73_9EURY|nr:hypothetical protein [Haloplanus aerogenes]AZH26845.1 hypothetical protein DU502_16335 [Haloplanus aerogenes]